MHQFLNRPHTSDFGSHGVAYTGAFQGVGAQKMYRLARRKGKTLLLKDLDDLQYIDIQ